MGCTKCTTEQPGTMAGELQAGQISEADLLCAALTELARGEGVVARALLCRALAAVDESEAGG